MQHIRRSLAPRGQVPANLPDCHGLDSSPIAFHPLAPRQGRRKRATLVPVNRAVPANLLSCCNKIIVKKDAYRVRRPHSWPGFHLFTLSMAVILSSTVKNLTEFFSNYPRERRDAVFGSVMIGCYDCCFVVYRPRPRWTRNCRPRLVQLPMADGRRPAISPDRHCLIRGGAVCRRPGGNGTL